MALVTRGTDVSVDTSTSMVTEQLSGYLAGEAIDAGAPCYVKAADSKIYMSNGAANDAAAKVDGFAPSSAAAGEAVTLHGRGTIIRYGTGLTVSALFYAAATAGRLDTAATTGGLVAIAKVLPGGRDIRVVNLVP
jgi:hypothetical protein